MANTLLIMGRRTQGAGCNTSCYSRIVALDAATLEPVTALWRYEGEETTTQGNAFYDRDSVNRLIVTAEGYDSVILSAGNVDFDPGKLINIVNKDKQLKQWGSLEIMRMYPIADEDNHDFQKVTASYACSFAIRTDGSIFGWGSPKNGGQLKPTTLERKDILEVVPSYKAGVLRGIGSPYIEQWGSATTGVFALPDYIAEMDNIVDLVCNDSARIVLTNEGKVYAWGDTDGGGVIPEDITKLNDIVAVHVNTSSACVLRSNGQVAAWGRYDAGGVVPDEIAALTDIVHIYSGNLSYVALRANGSIVIWGQLDEYSNFPDEIAALTNIVDVQYCSSPIGHANYVLLCDDGTVQGFGYEDTGVLPIPEGLKDVVTLSGSSQYCSALKKDGTVVNWGNSIYIDDSQVRDKLVNVRGIYSSSYCMAAITADDSLVVWGQTSDQKPMTLIPDGVQGNISYMQPYEGISSK